MKILAAIVSFLLIATPVLAVEGFSAGITPDSPIYGLDRAWERIQMAFERKEENRAKLHYEFAQERLAEAEEMTEKNRTDLAKELIDDYEEELNETNNEMKKARNLGRNITELAEHVANMTSKHLEVLQRVYDKVPESAKASIQHAMEVSIRKQVGVLEHIENKEQIRERIRQEVEERVHSVAERVKQGLREKLNEAIGKQDEEDKSCETADDCEMSLCDCQCHQKGQTREEKQGVLCGVNCLGEYNVSSCDCVEGECLAK